MGGGYLVNKLPELEIIISDEKPHVIGISEAVVLKGWDKNDFCINNYKLHVSDTIENARLNVSRICVLVHDSVTTKVRHDLMNESISSV